MASLTHSPQWREEGTLTEYELIYKCVELVCTVGVFAILGYVLLRTMN